MDNQVEREARERVEARRRARQQPPVHTEERFRFSIDHVLWVIIVVSVAIIAYYLWP